MGIILKMNPNKIPYNNGKSRIQLLQWYFSLTEIEQGELWSEDTGTIKGLISILKGIDIDNSKNEKK